jgi:DNA-binding transcriptional ArsR family regulator
MKAVIGTAKKCSGRRWTLGRLGRAADADLDARRATWLRLLIYNQMVVGTKSKTDDVFHALADSTRRDILRRAGTDASSVSRLADAYPMSFAAVQKHVVVLERAGLVTKRRRGREQLVEASPETLAEARRALDDLEEVWRGRVERMSELLESG